MNYEEIVNKKSFNKILTYDELDYLFNGYLNHNVDDELMTKMLKAICKYGMKDQEVFDLTKIFIDSGDILDLKDIPYTVDKHSTGGVGDKTTLIIGPIVASCGANVAKMSGRGLGHTGGTIDKLESIPGFNVELGEEEFISLVKTNHIAIMSQTKNLAPMDAVIYALRDVTETTESVPLIAVSIMSKKIASGAKNILIDIKLGHGALIKTKKDAKKLAKLMKKIGNTYHVNVDTMITKMDNPLGIAIGNALEVKEAIEILQNKRKGYLLDLCLELSSRMICMAKHINYKTAYQEALDALTSGKAYQKFTQLVGMQNGHLNNLKVSDKKQYILSIKSGKIKAIDALAFGKLSVSLGAGRKIKTDEINHSVGIVLNKVVGDKVHIGDLLCTLYVEDNTKEDVTKYFTIK